MSKIISVARSEPKIPPKPRAIAVEIAPIPKPKTIVAKSIAIPPPAKASPVAAAPEPVVVRAPEPLFIPPPFARKQSALAVMGPTPILNAKVIPQSAMQYVEVVLEEEEAFKSSIDPAIPSEEAAKLKEPELKEAIAQLGSQFEKKELRETVMKNFPKIGQRLRLNNWFNVKMY